MAEFSGFDMRGYPTVDIRTGYGEWADTYEGAVENAMDIALLEALRTVRWEDAREVADLAAAPDAPAPGSPRRGPARSTASISHPRCSREHARAACSGGSSRPM